MNRYLTLRQLFELREKLNLTDEQLDEPAIFTVQDGYGDQLAYPVSFWQESIHPSDGQARLILNGEELEMSLAYTDERAQEDGHEDDDEPDDENELPLRQLRKLPQGGLRLGFSEMDEDFEEATAWLAQPNPHTLPPAPRVPGPAPLFD